MVSSIWKAILKKKNTTTTKKAPSLQRRQPSNISRKSSSSEQQQRQQQQQKQQPPNGVCVSTSSSVAETVQDDSSLDTELEHCILGNDLQSSTVAKRNVMEQTWGEGFDGLELIDAIVAVAGEQQQKQQQLQHNPHPTRKPIIKRHGSIWHASVRSSEPPDSPRHMRSRASLVKLANNIEFDSEAFGSESEDTDTP